MINLGKSPSETEVMPPGKKDGEKYFPTLRISDVEGLADLPEGEFTFTAKGKMISYSEDLKRGTCSVELEVHSIEPSSKNVKKSKEADERLDESFDKIAKKKSKDYDEEE